MKSGPINREPRGFLDTFRLKVGGQTPLHVLEQVQPTIEMMPFYLGPEIGIQVNGTSSTSTSAAYPRTQVQVPADEVWKLEVASGYIYGTLATAQTVQAVLIIKPEGGTTYMIVDTSTFDKAAGAWEVADLRYVPQGTLLLQPGTIVGTGNGAGTVTGGSNLVYSVSCMYQAIKV